MPKLLEMRTTQSSSFKTVIEVLKEIITETNIHCDEEGIKICTMDSSHCALVHARLPAENFDHYFCDSSNYFGLSVTSLYKLLKSISNNDALYMGVDQDSPNELEIAIENGEKNSKTTFKMQLLDIDNRTFNIPEVETETLVTIPSTDFQRICRDMSNLTDTLEITSLTNKETLVLTGKGDFATQRTEIGSSEHGLSFSYNTEREEVTGKYNIKFISLFCKASSLSPVLEIYMRNEYPLFLKYTCTGLGTIQFTVAPKESGE